MERDARLRAGEVVKSGDGTLSLEDIKRILPHRDPFLFVDKVIETGVDKRIVGIKKITGEEYFFKGHFPGRPILPGVIMIEAMAQLSGILLLNKEECLERGAYFIGVNNVRFRKAIIPGDELRLEAEIVKMRTRLTKVHSAVKLGDEVICEADFMFGFGS
ncbi:MAG: 3-hydroxyacyl-ACP dehydratase FabZ [Candidatus Omnitrophica bacterium]|nr:3-hydroxyacyl-ACP dehydratase FabZ [Candidatus Omnitrophota bacterium]